MSDNLLVQIRHRTEECLVHAEKHFGISLPRPRIDFSLTGTTAGQYCLKGNVLRYNVKLAVGNQEDFLATTVQHEVAHAVQFLNFYKVGIAPHGKEWKKIMVECFKLPPRVCHNYDVSKVKRNTKSYAYGCACPGKIHQCGLIKHKKILKNARQYICLKCKQQLVFLQKNKTANDRPALVGGLREEFLD